MVEMLFKPIVDQVVLKSFASVLNDERKKDIENIGKCWDYYYGYQQKYIKQYEGESDEDYEEKDKLSFNYVKMVIDEYIQGVFGKPYQIKIGDKKYQEIWDNIESPNTIFEINKFMMKVQRVAEISDTCFVMIRYKQETKQVYFEEIRGEYLAFFPDEENPKEIGTVVISYLYDTCCPDPQERFKKRIEIWDKEQWAIYVYNPSKNKHEKVDSGINPYGFIPGVRFQPEEDDNTFYGISSIDSIVEINEVYNNLWTSLARIVVMQSFSLLVTKTDNDLNIKVSPKSFINFEHTENADAKFITPSPAITEVKQVLNDLKNELQDFSKIPVYSFSTSNQSPQSGYSLKIKRIPIEQLWKQRKMSYGPSMMKLVELSLIVDAINKGEVYKKTSIQIDFSEGDEYLSPSEQALVDERDMRYGLISPVDIMLRKNPDLTREEAFELIKRNQQEIEELTAGKFEGEALMEEGVF